MGRSHAQVTVLVVDDDVALRETLAEGLRDRGFTVDAVGGGEAVDAVRGGGHHVVLTDLRMPEVDGLSLVRLARQLDPERPVIVMTAFGAVDSAVEALRGGAYHYLLKPFKLGELALVIERGVEEGALRREARTLKQALRSRFSLDRLVTHSDGMRRVRELVERIADVDVNTLFIGETGTGKGMFARALHADSRRADGPFVAVNCAALPDSLLESELFGHVRGAFTGAHADRRGLFEQADGGFLFLDEIGDMPPSLQAKLLDVIERRHIRPLGSARERPVDVRVVAATHRDLREQVASGAFREDLFYRLDGITIEIPPLRERREDIPPLVEQLIDEARRAHPRAVVQRFASDAATALVDYDWPGNVRELENVVHRAVVLGRSEEATLDDLPRAVVRAGRRTPSLPFGAEIVPIRELQKQYAAWALERSGGRKSLACERLGIDAKTLNKWLATDDSREP